MFRDAPRVRDCSSGLIDEDRNLVLAAECDRAFVAHPHRAVGDRHGFVRQGEARAPRELAVASILQTLQLVEDRGCHAPVSPRSCRAADRKARRSSAAVDYGTELRPALRRVLRTPCGWARAPRSKNDCCGWSVAEPQIDCWRPPCGWHRQSGQAVQR